MNQRAPRPRSGSFMSTKQMAKAALDGRKIEMTLSTADEISGYLVGMDDFHWLIDNGGGPTLVHKAAAVTISFSHQKLDEESDLVKARVCKVGQPFWDAIKENQ